MAERELTPREELMQSVIEGDLENKKTQDGFDMTVLAQPGEEIPAPVRPADVSEEDWGQMSDEAKGEAARAVEPEPAPVEAPVKMVTIKVDGQEMQVPESEIIEAGIRARQQDTAADRRLEDAKRAKEEATRLLSEARELKETLGTPNQPPSGEVDFGAVAHAIQYGNKDEAAEALKRLQAKGSLDNQQLAQLVDERMAFQDAVNFYRSDYKEIASDPDWHKLFLLKEREARSGGDTRPYKELYKAIGDELKAKVVSIQPPVDQLAARRAAKSNQTPQPQSASARQPAPQETKEPTPSEVVAQMRASRHQP